MWWIVSLVIVIAFPPAIIPMGIYLGIMLIKMNAEMKSNNKTNSNNYDKQQDYDMKKRQDEALDNFNLGCKYYFAKGVVKDYTKAFEFFKKAADEGIESAQFNLGIMYENGQGILLDNNKAVEWYTKAAEQGYAGAQNNLGNIYKDGQGVSQDYKKAVEWYTKAAEQDNGNGQYNLGVMYEDGRGLAKDKKKAVEWYKKAAENGHEHAKNKIEILNKKIDIESNNNKAKNNKISFVKDSKEVNINYKHFYTKVAGVTIDDRQEKVKNLHKGQSLMLHREPFNSYDKNAIAIYAGKVKIGYLKKEIASEVAVLMDKGTSYYCEVMNITGGSGYNYGVNIKIEEMAIGHLYKLINNDVDKMFYNMIHNKDEQEMIKLSSEVLYKCISSYIITDSDRAYVKSTLTNQNVDSFGAMCTLALMSYFVQYQFNHDYNLMELYDNNCIEISYYIKHEVFKTEFVQYTWKVQEQLGLSDIFYNGLVDYCIGRTEQINNIVISKSLTQSNKSNQNNNEDVYEEDNYYYTLDEDEKQDYDDWMEYVDNH